MVLGVVDRVVDLVVVLGVVDGIVDLAGVVVVICVSVVVGDPVDVKALVVVEHPRRLNIVLND